MSKIREFIELYWGKAMTNWGKVKDGFDEFENEARATTTKLRGAYGRKEWLRVMHFATGYREAAQQHLYKLWFYAFWPRRVLEVVILILVYGMGKAAGAA